MQSQAPSSNKVCVMKMKREDFARGLSIISHKADLILAHVGHKVIPVSDAASGTTVPPLPKASTSASSVDQNDQSDESKERKSDKVKGNDTPHHKAKALARMKELVKRAAAAKTEKAGKYFGKKVLYFRNKGTLRPVPDDDQMSNKSPKISFRWDMESHSTTTSSCISRTSSSTKTHMPSKLSMDCSATDLIQDMDSSCSSTAYRKPGSWITTDSEFVVLEL